VISGGLLWWGLAAGPGRDASGEAVVSPGENPALQPSSRHRTITSDWNSVLANCDESADPELIRRQLADLKGEWLQEDLHEVAQSIGQLLKNGQDAKTGLRFEVGPGGNLRGWPTMRVFLLDVLAIADPDLAVEIAREVLASTSSAEEYAMALKPLLMEGPWRASDEELQAHFTKLLSTPEWQTREGFVEALDLARVVSSPGTAEILARWMDASPPALVAGEMAIHETAAKSPGVLVDILAKDSSLFADQPELRAGLMARATISDESQAGSVEGYLKDPSVPLAEKQQFLDLYPLRSATTGYRLYGKSPKPFDRGQVAADDRAALAAVNRWKADPAMAELLPSMNSLEDRLSAWTKQSGD